MKILFILFVISVTSLSCTSAAKDDLSSVEVPVETTDDAAKSHTTFPSYWGRGLAELNRYELKKARYSEQHEGEVVLVFVTEEFNTKSQVKYDSGERTDVVPILKLNAYERFYTGVYPYTILSSIFSPTDSELPFPAPYKMMSNVQEWCGAAWIQLNQNDDGYRARGFSYFQSEGDRDLQIPNGAYEDSLWNAIRINPATLPTGKTKMVPPLNFIRLMHVPIRLYSVDATLKTDQESEYAEKKVSTYTLDYPELQRQFTFHFETEFPHRIYGFEETKIALSGRELTSSGRLTKSIMLDYWNKHNNKDAPYRNALGLEH